MIKESIIPKDSEIYFFNELNGSTDSSFDIKILSDSLDNKNHSQKKENKLQQKLLGKKVKFQVLHENKIKFLIKKTNKKRNLSKKTNLNIGKWNESEKLKFIEGIYKFGPNWRVIKHYIGTRLTTQVLSHAQKFFLKCKKFKDDSLGIDFTKDSSVDKKYIIKTLKDIIDNSKNDNIIEILYQKLEKYKLSKDVFKNNMIRSDDKLNEINIINDINTNNEINYNSLSNDDNYNDLKQVIDNKFELKDYNESIEKINLIDFDGQINRTEHNRIFKDFSFFSKDNDFIINEFIDMDIHNNNSFSEISIF